MASIEQQVIPEAERQAACLESILGTYPDIGIRSAHLHTGSGQFNDILFINEDLIFRFPRYIGSIPGFLREIELLTRLQGRLPLPIPNPLYTSHGATEPGKVFMGYQLLPGQPLYREVLNGITDEATLQAFARQLEDFLSTLHRLTPAELGLDLPWQDMLAESRLLFAEVREHLFPLMRPEAPWALIEYFEHYFDTPDLHLYQPALIHGDFGSGNILFDADGISGIIDFSFACYGDPAVDLASVSTFGDRFFARICQFYPLTQSMLKRAKFYRGTFALQEALHGFKNNDKEAFESGMEQYV